MCLCCLAWLLHSCRVGGTAGLLQALCEGMSWVAPTPPAWDLGQLHAQEA